METMPIEHCAPGEVGGYFELEFGAGTDFPHGESVLLNSGRSCLEYVLKAHSTTRVYLPTYTCDAVLAPLRKLGIDYTFYRIDRAFEMAERLDLRENEKLVYINYFGLKDQYSSALSEQLGYKLILDCSQAYFSPPPKNCHVFYSPRKFVGVPDGGALYTDKILPDILEVGLSSHRISHLIKRIEEGAQAGYSDFLSNEESLGREPIKRMSQLTTRLLRAIDHATVARKRKRNFGYLQTRLASFNLLSLADDQSACPMNFPFLCDDDSLRAKLIDHKIFVPTYWPDVLARSSAGDFENELTRKLLPLPIDQRYGESEMGRIADLILCK